VLWIRISATYARDISEVVGGLENSKDFLVRQLNLVHIFVGKSKLNFALRFKLVDESAEHGPDLNHIVEDVAHVF